MLVKINKERNIYLRTHIFYIAKSQQLHPIVDNFRISREINKLPGTSEIERICLTS